MRFILACFCLVILSLTNVSAQSAECPAVVQEILTIVDDVCDDTGRNQICYGNIALTAEGRNDAFRLDAVGEIANLADMQSLSLSPYNEDTDEWGVALMQVQANLPDTIPDQNVTMIAFGDVSLTNAINTPIEISATLSANGRTRSTPTTANGDLNVLTAISSGTSVEVLGRDEVGDWLLIRLPETSVSGAEYGWISTQVLSISGDKMGLNIFEDTVLDFGAPPATTPMSAFYLKTGISTTNCAEKPPDGVLIQTPQDTGRVEMTVNGVKMSFGSTVFLKTVDNLLAVIVIEGTAIITANGKTQFLPAGTESFIPLNDDLTAPIDIPSDPSPYQSTDVLYLPITDAIQLVPRPVTIIDPPTPEQIMAATRDSFAPNGAIDGLYYFILTEMTMLMPPSYTTGFCQEADGTGLGYRARMEFTPTGIVSNVGVADGLVRIDERIWGDPERDHQDLSVLGPAGTEGFASTFYSVSPGVIEEKRSVMTNNNLGQSLCVGIITGTWIAP